MKPAYKLNINIGSYKKGIELFPYNEGTLFGPKNMRPGQWGLNKKLIKVMVENRLVIDLNPKEKVKKVSQTQKAIEQFRKDLLKEKIDHVIIPNKDAFIYQYRINSAECYLQFLKKDKSDGDEDNEFNFALGDILRKKITRGYTEDGTIEGKDLLKIFKGTGVKIYVEMHDKKTYLLTTSEEFNIEVGSDS